MAAHSQYVVLCTSSDHKLSSSFKTCSAFLFSQMPFSIHRVFTERRALRALTCRHRCSKSSPNLQTVLASRIAILPRSSPHHFLSVAMVASNVFLFVLKELLVFQLLRLYTMIRSSGYLVHIYSKVEPRASPNAVAIFMDPKNSL